MKALYYLVSIAQPAPHSAGLAAAAHQHPGRRGLGRVSVASTARALAVPAALNFRRLRLPPGAVPPAWAIGRRVGPGAGALNAALLAPEGDVFDAWIDATAAAERRHGCVRYATDGDWLHGLAEIDDRAGGLQAAAHRAYADLFELLAASRCAAPAAAWNYFADINAREPAASSATASSTSGASRPSSRRAAAPSRASPAACALGTHGGPAARLLPRRAPAAAGDREPAPGERLPLPRAPTARAARPSRAPRWPRRATAGRRCSSRAPPASSATRACTWATCGARPKKAWPTSHAVRQVAAEHVRGVAFPAGDLRLHGLPAPCGRPRGRARGLRARVGAGSPAARERDLPAGRHLPRRPAGRDRGPRVRPRREPGLTRRRLRCAGGVPRDRGCRRAARAGPVAARGAGADPASDVQRPLWELGLGVAGLRLPDYRGSDQSQQLRCCRCPTSCTAAPGCKADRDGARALLFDTPRARRSTSASPPRRRRAAATTRRATACPTCRRTAEVGPNLNLTLAELADRPLEARPAPAAARRGHAASARRAYVGTTLLAEPQSRPRPRRRRLEPRPADRAAVRRPQVPRVLLRRRRRPTPRPRGRPTGRAAATPAGRRSRRASRRFGGTWIGAFAALRQPARRGLRRQPAGAAQLGADASASRVSWVLATSSELVSQAATEVPCAAPAASVAGVAVLRRCCCTWARCR